MYRSIKVFNMIDDELWGEEEDEDEDEEINEQLDREEWLSNKRSKRQKKAGGHQKS